MGELEQLKQEIDRLVNTNKKALVLEEFCRAAFIVGNGFKRERVGNVGIVPRSLISIRDILREQKPQRPIVRANKKFAAQPAERCKQMLDLLHSQPNVGLWLVQKQIDRPMPTLSQEPFKKKLPPAPLPLKILKPEIKIKPFLAEKPEEKEKKYPLIQIGDKVLVSTEINDMYRIVEPQIIEIDKRVIAELKNYKPQKLSKRKFLEKKIGKLCTKFKTEYSEDYFNKIKYFIDRDLFGLGKLEPLLKDGKISSVLCTKDEVRIVYGGVEKRTNIEFGIEELDKFIETLARRYGIDLKKEPIFDKTLSTGIRIQATYGGKIVSSRFVVTRPINF